MLLEPYMFTTSERDIIDNFHTIKKTLIFLVLLGFSSETCSCDSYRRQWTLDKVFQAKRDRVTFCTSVQPDLARPPRH
jgi:hypothetical protein